MPNISKENNTLAAKSPELASQWHPTRNGAMTPEMVTCGSNKKVWWFLGYDDPKTGKHFDFEWQARILDRTKGAGCPFLTGNAVWTGFNDLATKYPEIASQWHPALNGELKPQDVTYGSKRMVWWMQPHDDPKTGKHFDFEWQASPNARVCGNGCPFLAGQAVFAGYNDLESRYPEVASQWHPTKNEGVLPSKVSYASNKTYWWREVYVDPILGQFDFEWQAKVVNRTLLGEKCPFLGNDKVWVSYNDLDTRFPQIAAEWHPTKNGDLNPRDVTYGSGKSVWWHLPYYDPESGKHFDFEWKAPINIRTGAGTNDGHQTGCPYLAPNPKVWVGFNDLESRYPEVAAEWNYEKNRNLTPAFMLHGTTKKVWWKCSKCNHEWYASVKSRTFDEVGCPVCRKTAFYK